MVAASAGSHCVHSASRERPLPLHPLQPLPLGEEQVKCSVCVMSSITEIPEDLVEGNTTQFNMKALKSSLSEQKAKLAELQKRGAPDREIFYVMGKIALLNDLIIALGERPGGTRRRRRAGRKSKGGKTLRRRTTKK